jgi:secreted trypsin-like serine protease
VARPVSLPVRMLVLAAVTAAAALLATLPGAAPAGAVAHGAVVPEGQYRFNARLTMTSIPGPGGMLLASVCSGALIAPSWVITAGHCFVDPVGSPVSGPVPYPTTATIGQTDLLSPGRRRHTVPVTEVRQAPGTDIALGRLAHPVADTPPLPLATTAPAVGTTLRLVGWGATNPLIPLPATRLHTGLVTVSSVTDTTVGVRGLSPAPDTSACLYDSGAPYFTEGPEGPRLVSVESDGPPCPHDQEETTARVDTVASWLAETVRFRR